MWLDGVMTADYTVELTATDKDRLRAASAPLSYGDRAPGIERYCFYRRKGYSRSEALLFAFAWCRNAVEQKARRLAHDTGAENWL